MLTLKVSIFVSVCVCVFPGDMKLTETPIIFFHVFQEGKAAVEIGRWRDANAVRVTVYVCYIHMKLFTRHSFTVLSMGAHSVS